LIETQDITAVILCGGKGSRFGPFEKPLARFTTNGRSCAMVDHVIATLPEGLPRLISANRHLDDYATRGQIICDVALPGTEGPLLGIYSAMLAARRSWILVCPGDMPLLARDWHQPLLESVADLDTPRVLHDGERLQSLLCLIPTRLRENLHRYLEGGGKSVHLWHRQANALQVVVSGSVKDFTNINTQDALEDLSDPQL